MVDSTILRVSDLNVAARARGGSMLPIVSDISFAIEPGKVLALIGESGSGKTTISLAAMGYARPGCVITGGIVDLAGTDILSLDFPARRKLRGSDIAYVAQSAAASFNAALRLDLQVTETPIIKGLMSATEAHDKAVSLYRQLDLPDPEIIGQRYPHQVSGGQLQRLMAAMAMICDPKLLILDEPTTALDVTTQIEVLHAFKKLIRERGTSAIYVSHDLAVVAQIADHILVLKDGQMVEYGDVEKIVHAPRETYTRELLAAAHILPKSIPAKKSTPHSAQQHPLLKVDKVTAAFGRNAEFIALKDVSLELAEARTLGVIGESGSGKTTLGRVICGLKAPLRGQVTLDGQVLAPEIQQRDRDQLRSIQFAFQMAETALNPRHTVEKILGRPLQFYFNLSGAETARRVGELLELVEMPASYARRLPRELSGGQRQRVNLARALAAEPRVVICDEITSALDTIVAQAILQLLDDLQQRLKAAYVFISHDISTVAQISHDIAVMRNGVIVANGPTADILKPPHHEYTELLLSSVPEMRTDWLDDVTRSRGNGLKVAQ